MLKTRFSLKKKSCEVTIGYFVYGPIFCDRPTRRRIRLDGASIPVCNLCKNHLSQETS